MKNQNRECLTKALLSITRQYDYKTNIRNYDVYFWFDEMVAFKTKTGQLINIVCTPDGYLRYTDNAGFATDNIPNRVHENFMHWNIEENLLGDK